MCFVQSTWYFYVFPASWTVEEHRRGNVLLETKPDKGRRWTLKGKMVQFRIFSTSLKYLSKFANPYWLWNAYNVVLDYPSSRGHRSDRSLNAVLGDRTLLCRMVKERMSGTSSKPCIIHYNLHPCSVHESSAKEFKRQSERKIILKEKMSIISHIVQFKSINYPISLKILHVRIGYFIVIISSWYKLRLYCPFSGSWPNYSHDCTSQFLRISYETPTC